MIYYQEVNHAMDPGLCGDKVTIEFNDGDRGNVTIDIIQPAVVYVPTSQATLSVQTCERQVPTTYDFFIHPLGLFLNTRTYELDAVVEETGDLNLFIF